MASDRPEQRNDREPARKFGRTPRPAGSYRGARRKEAREAQQPMLTYPELRLVTQIAAYNRSRTSQ